MKRKVAFFVNSLYGGGAEKVLQTLLRHLDKSKFEVTLYSLHKETVDDSYPQNISYRYIYGHGKITDYYAIGECFIGVDLEPGKHEIEMSYTPQGLYPGLIISAISLVIFMAIIISKNSKKDDGDSVENTNNDIDRTENI